MVRLKLKIEPIPSTTWGVSLANKLEPKEWDKIRHEVYYRAKYKCDICRAPGWNCHEVWTFRKIGKKKGIQRLVGVTNLCDLCHNCVHYGRSSQVYKNKYMERLKKHFMKVNGITERQFLLYLEGVKRISYDRADRSWRVVAGDRILAYE